MPKKERTGTIFDPEFRSERARIAGIAAQTGPAIVKRFLSAVEAGRLSEQDIDQVRQALSDRGTR
jgi:hypothetical protein